MATLSAETGSGRASQPDETISFQKPEIPEVKTRVHGAVTGHGQLVRKSPTKQEVIKGLSSQELKSYRASDAVASRAAHEHQQSRADVQSRVSIPGRILQNMRQNSKKPLAKQFLRQQTMKEP